MLERRDETDPEGTRSVGSALNQYSMSFNMYEESAGTQRWFPKIGAVVKFE